MRPKRRKTGRRGQTWVVRSRVFGLKDFTLKITDSGLTFLLKEKNLGVSTYQSEVESSIEGTKWKMNLDARRLHLLGIRNSLEIAKGDRILVIGANNRVLKLGTVTDIPAENDTDEAIRFGVEWDPVVDSKKIMVIRHNPFMAVQALTSMEMLLPDKRLVAKRGKLFPGKRLGIAGKEGSEWLDVKQYSAPVGRTLILSTSGEGDVTAPTDEQELQLNDPGGVVKLFFGTSRKCTGSTSPNEYFGEERSSISLGTCHVSIPPGHKKGELERPHEYWVYQFDEKEKKHVCIRDIGVVSGEEFSEMINKDLENKEQKAAFIFIHGFDTTFADAARRAAQITYDVPFNGITGFFSWPAGEVMIDYGKADDLVQLAGRVLQNFVEHLLEKTAIDRLHLIGHSMGGRLMAFTVKELSQKPALAEKVKKISQLVLVAPDIGQEVFRETILPEFIRIGAQRTLYTSNKDKALKLSRRLRRGLARLGDSGKNLFVEKGIDTVDASNVKSKGNNHSYVFEEKEVLTDLHYVLEQGIKPDQRDLKPRTKNKLFYWLFPE